MSGISSVLTGAGGFYRKYGSPFNADSPNDPSWWSTANNLNWAPG